MARITIKEAVAITPVSESTLRRDIKSGKVSSEKDERGRRRIDTAELARVYGQLTHSTAFNDQEMTAVDTPENSTVDVNDTPDTPSDAPKIIELLENQIADLKTQLELSNQRETALIDEKSQLLNMLSDTQNLLTAEKEEKRALMPPVEEQDPKTRNWLLRLVGAR
ncbi:MAG: hypothetical protein OXC79_04960 [Candidatus Poribacteria bacterium]|nr:hypothetical protein [Candidatus Poribacteria bacterium]